MSGLLVVVSSPSGGGKTTVIDTLLTLIPRSVRFPTTTTRLPRPNERPGVDYNFITRSEFVYKIVHGDFIEHVSYAGHYYGTDQRLLTQMLNGHSMVFAAIDVRGKKSLEALSVPQVSIFLEPESLAMLEERINRRPDATKEDTARRLAVAKEEIAQASAYTHRIVNAQGKFDETVAQVKAVLDKIGQTR